MSEVFAIKSLRNIATIKSQLKKTSMRNYTIFVLGINVGLRACDLLNLQVQDVFDESGNVREDLRVNEQKTSKDRVLYLNDSASATLQEYHQYQKEHGNFNLPDEYLFQSRKGTNQPITVRSLNRLVKTWCDNAHMKGNYGTHSLRKTFGYFLYTNNSANPYVLPYLQRIFRHSSQLVTLRYIGIEEKEIYEMYNELNL